MVAVLWIVRILIKLNFSSSLVPAFLCLLSIMLSLIYWKRNKINSTRLILVTAMRYFYLYILINLDYHVYLNIGHSGRTRRPFMTDECAWNWFAKPLGFTTKGHLIDRNIIQSKALMWIGNGNVMFDYPIETRKTSMRFVWNLPLTNRIGSFTPAVFHGSAPGFHFWTEGTPRVDSSPFYTHI